MIKVLFVCLGNICRSPLAEAIFKDLIKKKALANHIQCDSAGTANYHVGGLPDIRSTANAKKNGITIQHKGQQINRDFLEKFDYVLAMDSSNFQNILKLEAKDIDRSYKLFMIREFDDQADSKDVPDPYFGGEQGFETVFQILKRSNVGFMDYLVIEHRLGI